MYLPFGEASGIGVEIYHFHAFLDDRIPDRAQGGSSSYSLARSMLGVRFLYNAHQNINDTDVYRFCLDPFTCTIKGYSSR